MSQKLIEIAKVFQTPLKLNAKAGDKILIITDTADGSAALAGPGHRGQLPGHGAGGHRHDAARPPRRQPRQPGHACGARPGGRPRRLPHQHGDGARDDHRGPGRREQEVHPDGGTHRRHAHARRPRLGRLRGHEPPRPEDRQGLHRGRHVRVTCPNGTDLTASIKGRPGRSIAGMPLALHPGKGGGCAFPDGEAHVCPVEGTGEGRVVFDLTAHSVGALKEPIILTVEKGMVTKIEGGHQAQIWRNILEQGQRPRQLQLPGRSLDRPQHERDADRLDAHRQEDVRHFAHRRGRHRGAGRHLPRQAAARRRDPLSRRSRSTARR